MDGAGSSLLHVVIFPWLAFGHLLPGLELAERLASRGHRVSFVSTRRNITRLRPVAPSLAPFIELVALPLPRVDGLPDDAEATSDIPPGKADLHLKAFDALAAPFSAFLDAARADGSGKKVDWAIVDSFHHWAAADCHGRGIPCVLSMTYSAATLEQYGVPRGASAAVDDLGPSIVQRFVLTFERCKLIAHRSCFELEADSLPLLSNIFGKPVVPVGLLPPSPAGEGHGKLDAATLSWLDKTGRQVSRIRRLRKRGSIDRRAAARGRTGAGARGDELPLGSEEASWRPRAGHPAVGFPGADARPWARRHGLGTSAPHPGAPLRWRVHDTLRMEFDYREAYVRATFDYASVPR